MAGVAGKIKALRQPVDEAGTNIGNTEGGKGNTGRAHDFGGQYHDAMQKLSHLVTNYGAAIEDFSSRLVNSKAGYQWSEETAADSFKGQ
ncbi:hypothetical protein D5S17_30615 [Pseudonocardiaceae bacterium YIM PH 21723]|nr:hypothetical protein D5S17_30615 [Pseudonocardiaceae bacterium YIM PH 21723]